MFSDSSWGQSPHPYGGHAIFFCGAAVAFSARKLKIAPQSSAEAELAVYSTAAKDLRFVLNLLGELQMSPPLPVKIYCLSEYQKHWCYGTHSPLRELVDLWA